MHEHDLNHQDLELMSHREDDPWDPGLGSPMVWQYSQSGSTWRPPTDVYETESGVVVLVEIAGMRGADIQVTYDQEVLYIRGKRCRKENAVAFQQMEISYGDFMVGIRISTAVDSSAVQATYSDGFLKVELPKVKPHRVEIQE